MCISNFYQFHNSNFENIFSFKVPNCYISQLTCFVLYFVGRTYINVFYEPLLHKFEDCFEEAEMYDIVGEIKAPENIDMDRLI